MTFIYIYAKDGKIKVLNHKEALKSNEILISKGWIHTHTLDACVYLEYLHNERGYFDRGTDIDLLSRKE